jgi:hypothetical protein
LFLDVWIHTRNLAPDPITLRRYDIPVLHINGVYWAKHRISASAAMEALDAARAQTLAPSNGQPDANRLERRVRA